MGLIDRWDHDERASRVMTMIQVSIIFFIIDIIGGITEITMIMRMGTMTVMISYIGDDCYISF